MPLDTHASLANLDLHEAKRIKIPVRAASTANVSLTAPGATIDGVTLVANDRVLLKNQTTASQNGIYVWTGAAATLTRATDANSAALLFFGFLVYVREGTANGGTLWMFTQSAAVTLETTALTFSAVGATNLAGEMTAADFNVTGLTGATAGMRMVGATTTGAPTTGTFAVGDVVEDRAAGGLWACTVAGTPGTWVRTGFANPMTTVGDLIVGGAVGAATRLAAGTATNVLTSNGPGVSPTWQPAPAGGGGGGTGGGSGNPVSNSLAADVSVPTANVFVDGPTLTLTPGTWNLTGQVTCVNAVATDFTAKLWDGTTVLDSAQDSSRVGTVGISIQVSGAVVVTATTTFKISVAGNNATSTIKAATTVNASGNTASTLTATPAGSPAPGNTSNALYQQTKIRGTGNKTTTSTSFVALDATNLPPLSLTLTVGDIVRCILMCESTTASGSGAMFDFQVVQPTLGTTRTNPTAAGGTTTNADLSHIPTTVIATFTASETGVHTFQPVWATAVAAVTITVFNATTPADQDVEVLFSIEKLAPALVPSTAGSGGIGGGAMVPLQVVQLGAAQASVTFSVPNTCRHLVLIANARIDAAASGTGAQFKVQFNGDTAANYDNSLNGAASASGTFFIPGEFTGSTNTVGAFSSFSAHIYDYNATDKWKQYSSIELANFGSANMFEHNRGGAWRSTAAISSIAIAPNTAGNFVAGSTFVLYGISDTPTSIPAAQSSLIQEVILGTASASIALTNIPQTYRDLRIVWQARGDTVANNTTVTAQFNGDTGANYDREQLFGSAAAVGAAEGIGQTSVIVGEMSAASSPAGSAGAGYVSIPNYTATTFRKGIQSINATKKSDASAGIVGEIWGGEWRNTAAIASILLAPAAGNFVAGTVVRLYGEPATSLPKIAEAVLSTSQATVTFSSIPQTYRNLRLTWQTRGDTVAINTQLKIQFNGDTTATYDAAGHVATATPSSGGTGAGSGVAQTSGTLGDISAASSPAGSAGAGSATFPNYSGTAFRKSGSSNLGFKQADTAAGTLIEGWFTEWRNTSAISSMVLFPAAGNFVTGSVFALYGEP